MDGKDYSSKSCFVLPQLEKPRETMKTHPVQPKKKK